MALASKAANRQMDSSIGTVGKGEMPGALDGREVESAGLVEEQCFATGLENLDGDWGGEEMGGGGGKRGRAGWGSLDLSLASDGRRMAG